MRWGNEEKLIVVSNFSQDKVRFNLRVPASLLEKMGIEGSSVNLEDQLYHQFKTDVQIVDDMEIPMHLESNQSYILTVN